MAIHIPHEEALTMKTAHHEIFELSHGEVVAWVDPGAALHLRCVTPTQGDPVEFNAQELKALIAALQELLREIE